MYDCPKSLEDLCINTICDHIVTYIVPYDSEPKGGWWDKHDCSDSSIEDDVEIFKFRDPDIFIINEISEKLLNKLVEKKLLCDATLNIFTSHNTLLKKFKIRNCKVSKNGLQILKQHNLTELECVNLKRISIGDILDCLNEWTIANLTNVSFRKCTFIDQSRYSFMVKVTNLRNLRILNLAYTELNQTMFELLCDDLKHLEHLDISGTKVIDLRPLTQLSSKLVSLSVSDLPEALHLVLTLEDLIYLRYLDISYFNDKIDDNLYLNNIMHLMDILENSYALPNLVSIDLSGWKDLITKKVVLNFLEIHPNLEFLGLVLCSVAFHPVFSDLSGMNFSPNLIIAGLGNEEQIKVTLKKYLERGSYIQKALYHLFQLSGSFQEARPDFFKLVLDVMEMHRHKFGIQMAATACLYNLTRGELSKRLHPSLLSKGVNLTLYAMQNFPGEFQLQKNALLTLCSDRILQEVTFDRFRCAKLVLDALCHFEDVNMDRMAVAICSILAAKVSTEETSQLGACASYMCKLLAMVRGRVELKQADVTLKFTLSALWNLTDESATTCTVFLEKEGAELFLEVLKVFKDNMAIETKVLGLLNNIAEVKHLRQKLMQDLLIQELYTLLKSPNIDVSYFAAGIIAHLASDGEACWQVGIYTRQKMLMELESAVSHWKVPESEMVAYRSFKPFFPLLRIEVDYQVQLWAVWAIHHVCTKNSKRYCLMLHEEGGYAIIKDLVCHEAVNPEIRRICQVIIDGLNTDATSS